MGKKDAVGYRKAKVAVNHPSGGQNVSRDKKSNASTGPAGMKAKRGPRANNGATGTLKKESGGKKGNPRVRGGGAVAERRSEPCHARKNSLWWLNERKQSTLGGQQSPHERPSN